MPIGVPKVPFRSPGVEDASWVDVQCDFQCIDVDLRPMNGDIPETHTET